MKIHDPGNTQPITALYAVLSVDQDGNEGIIATTMGPAICGYEKNARALFELAQRDLVLRGPAKYQLRLARFETKTILE